MKKILIVTRSMYKNGGVESSLLNLLDEVGSMYDIDVLAFAISNDYKDKLKKSEYNWNKQMAWIARQRTIIL